MDLLKSLCLALTLFSAPSWAQVDDPRTTLPAELREAQLHARWDEVLSGLQELESARPEQQDFFLYLRAKPEAQAGRKAEAEALLAGFAERFPQSSWRYKAAFWRAELLHELGSHREAQALWGEAARRLLSVERKDSGSKAWA